MSGFPVHARFAHPDWGYNGDQERAAEYLIPGRVYAIESMHVGRSASYLTLTALPGVQFNTVMFEPDGPGFADEEPGG
jgi:hypothetical protein